jgi:glycosyltransferase involved in cell wall biosynthesis
VPKNILSENIFKMSEKNPLVTVIALCYNHEKFIEECLQSVVSQTYTNIELIIVDDFSTDNSREKILSFKKANPSTQIILNDKNIGNCRSFNQAFHISKGKYVIDFSTDDVMLPEKIEEQVKLFERSEKIGVVFSDADFIDEDSNYLGNNKKGLFLPEGNVYENLLRGKIFNMPSSMMMRRTILEELGGYDETLSYEDFDFWVRSSRICEYGYVPQLLSFQRISKGSHSTKSIQKHSPLIQSSVKVCQKAFLLNETESENEALSFRLRKDVLRCALTENFESGEIALDILKKIKGHNWKTRLAQIIIFLKIPLNPLYIFVMNLRRLLRFKTLYN